MTTRVPSSEGGARSASRAPSGVSGGKSTSLAWSACSLPAASLNVVAFLHVREWRRRRASWRAAIVCSVRPVAAPHAGQEATRRGRPLRKRARCSSRAAPKRLSSAVATEARVRLLAARRASLAPKAFREREAMAAKRGVWSRGAGLMSPGSGTLADSGSTMGEPESLAELIAVPGASPSSSDGPSSHRIADQSGALPFLLHGWRGWPWRLSVGCWARGRLRRHDPSLGALASPGTRWM